MSDVTRHTSTPHPPSAPNYLDEVCLSFVFFLSKTIRNGSATLGGAGKINHTQYTIRSGNDTARNIELNPPATSRTAACQAS